MVEEQVSLTVQHVFNAGLGDDGIITLEPLVLVLPDEARVVATLQGPLVVNDCKQGIFVVITEAVCWLLVLPVHPALFAGCHEGGHVQYQGKGHICGNLPPQFGRVFKSFEMKACDNGQFLHGELLSRLLVAVTATAFDLGAASQMLWSSESSQAVCQGCGP